MSCGVPLIFLKILLQGSLKAYEKASQLLTETVGTDIPPEILNNIGCLHFKLGQYKDSRVQWM